MSEEILTPEIGTETVPEEPTIPQETTETTPPAVTPPLDPENDPNSVEYWKKKNAEQARENIVLNHQIEDRTRRDTTNEPTEVELRAAIPDWDLLTESEKFLARRDAVREKQLNALLEKQTARELKERFDTDVEVAVETNPSLEGKEREFKAYAEKLAKRNVPVDVAVKAFLTDNPSTPAPKTPKQGLEPGGGGPRETTNKPKLLSVAELKTLRETNSNGYREYVQQHPEALEI